MKKQLFAFFLTFALILTFIKLPVIAKAEGLALNPNAPAIPTIVGESVDLSTYTYEGIALDQFKFTPVNGGKIENSVFIAEQKGAYAFDCVNGNKNFRMLIVAKNSEDKDYVVYEKNSFTLEDLNDFKIVDKFDIASVTDDGVLKLKSGDSSRILMPAYFSNLGNFKVEVNARMVKPTDGQRWMSVMYRIKNYNEPNPNVYYQMAIRKNAATNGVELAHHSPTWKVPYKASYSENLAENKFYKMTVEAYNESVVQSVNDEPLICANDVKALKSGGLGLQVNKCEMYVSSIKVCLQLEKPVEMKPKPAFSNVRAFDQNIITTPSVVSYVNTKEDYDNILNLSPSNAIYNLNKNGEITDKENNKIANLDDMFEKIAPTVIPVFNVSDKETIDKLVSYCKTNRYEDLAVASSNPELVTYAHKANKMFRGIIIFDNVENTKEGLNKVRTIANSNCARTVILPHDIATKENVEYLQRLLVNVWTGTTETESEVSVMKEILSGSNGIVVNNRQIADNCFKNYFKKGTMIRHSYIIAHRGVPMQAPENSLEGMLLAYKLGADIVENDVYLTTDGVVVVMHDKTIDRTTDGHGDIESMTYEELQKYTLKAAHGVEGCKIPTLEQYLQEISKMEENKQLFIEIKSNKSEIVPKVIELIRKYHMEHNVNILSFSFDKIREVKTLAPEISIGSVYGGVLDGDTLENVRSAVNIAQANDSTFNPSSNHLSAEFIRQLSHRGITSWTWTYRSPAALSNHYMLGINGLTTDDCGWMEKVAKKVIVKNLPKEITAGEKFEVEAYSVLSNGENIALGDKAEVVIVGNNGKVVGNTITAEEGKVYGYVRCKTSFYSREMYVCSELFALDVVEKTAPEPTPDPDSNPDPDPTPDPNPDSESESDITNSESDIETIGCSSSVSSTNAIILAVGLGAAALLISLKRKIKQ